MDLGEKRLVDPRGTHIDPRLWLPPPWSLPHGSVWAGQRPPSGEAGGMGVRRPLPESFTCRQVSPTSRSPSCLL